MVGRFLGIGVEVDDSVVDWLSWPGGRSRSKVSAWACYFERSKGTSPPSRWAPDEVLVAV